MSKYAKSLTPLLASAIGLAVQWIATGRFDGAELATTITGLVTSALAYLVPNKPKG